MSKKVKTFLKIIYYVFTFGLGLVLAVVLPGMKYYEQTAFAMERALTTGDYDYAMSLIGGYYDDEQVFEVTYEDGSGIVVYSAATLTADQKAKRYYMNTVYAGFLFNTQGKYKVRGDSSANKARLEVVDSVGTKKDITLLNYDVNGDEKNDTISTLEDFTYVYFEIPVGFLNDISKITFYDMEDNVYRSASLALDFNERLFDDIAPFKAEYNKEKPTEDTLNSLAKSFEEKNQEHYKMSSHEDIKKKSNRDAVLFVLFYFIAIYILGDCLVGKRYIWHGLVWCYKKIRLAIENAKRKKKGEAPILEEEPTAALNTLLRVHLNVPKDCNTNVSINYHNENNEINLVLTRDNSYTQSMVVPSGSYVNAWLECPGYHTVNLPKTLDVKGYRMTVEVTLEKSDKNLMDDNEIINNKMEVKDENHN